LKKKNSASKRREKKAQQKRQQENGSHLKLSNHFLAVCAIKRRKGNKGMILHIKCLKRNAHRGKRKRKANCGPETKQESYSFHELSAWDNYDAFCFKKKGAKKGREKEQINQEPT